MQLKVLTFNIHKGLNRSSRKLVLDKIRALLVQLDADIIFLQEVQGEHAKRSEKFAQWPEEAQVEYLAGEQWPHHFYGKNHCHEHGHHGNAILCKYPLMNSMNVDISAHRLSSRGLLYSQMKLSEEAAPLHLICTHFGLFKKERTKQFEWLNQFVKEKIADDEPLLVAGDFNDWRSASLKLLHSSLGLTEVFNETHGKYAKTFPAELPVLKVDRIYSRGLTVKMCDVIKTKGISDHLPLVAEFEMKDEE